MCKQTLAVLLLLFSLLTVHAEPPDYFPLAIGNSWTYHEFGYDQNPHTLSIFDTTRIDGQLYYKYGAHESSYSIVRKDSLGRIYKRIDDLDLLWFDFTISEAASYFYQEREFLPHYTVRNTSQFIKPLVPDFVSSELAFVLNFHTSDQTDSDYIYTFVPSIGIVVESGGLGINFVLQSATINGQVISTLEDKLDRIPARHNFKPNYPNPFNPITTLHFNLTTTEFITLKILNLKGQLVEILVQQTLPSGAHAIPFDANGLSSGIYFAILETDSFICSRKILLAK